MIARLSLEQIKILPEGTELKFSFPPIDDGECPDLEPDRSYFLAGVSKSNNGFFLKGFGKRLFQPYFFSL